MVNDQPNIIVDKSYAFALESVKLYRYMTEQQNEFVLSKQFLRSATSVGANVEEAQAAQSKKDFISKMAISSKEARESKYWLRLMRDANYIHNEHPLLTDIESIINILTKIVKTGSENAK
jgi:four helix bundle protein